MSDWFEDEEFWRIFGDCMFDAEHFRAAVDEIPALLQLAGIPVAQVLDLGCGPGRHSVPLAQTGIAVTAVDIVPAFLARGRELASAQDVEQAIDWQQADMRSFSRPGSFDLVINMWTSFGYFEDPFDDARVLAQCFENLRSGGVLLLDTAGKEIVCRDIEPVMATELADGALLVERPTLEDDMSRYSNQWHLLRDGQVHTATWHHNLYSGAELKVLLGAAGFEHVAVYGDLHAAPYDIDAQRLVAVAVKS